MSAFSSFTPKPTWKRLTRKKPLNKISKDPIRLLKRFVPKDVLYQVQKRDGGLCCFPMGCQDEYQVKCWQEADGGVHHILPRSQGGKHELSNLTSLCRFHHSYVHSNPEEAYKIGMLKKY